MERICDKCRNLNLSLDNTRETCEAKKEGSKYVRLLTKDYSDLRLNADSKNCKGFRKI